MPIEFLAKESDVLALARDYELSVRKHEDAIVLSSEDHSIEIKPVYFEDRVLYSRRETDLAIRESIIGGKSLKAFDADFESPKSYSHVP